MPIGLHDVKLGTEVSARTTVFIGVAILEWVQPIVDSRHANDGHLGDAATANIAQVDVVLNRTTQKIRTVVLGSVESRRDRQKHPLAHAKLDSLLLAIDSWLCLIGILHVEVQVDVILSDLYLRVATSGCWVSLSCAIRLDLQIADCLHERVSLTGCRLGTDAVLHEVHVVTASLPRTEHKGHLSEV